MKKQLFFLGACSLSTLAFAMDDAQPTEQSPCLFQLHQQMSVSTGQEAVTNAHLAKNARFMFLFNKTQAVLFDEQSDPALKSLTLHNFIVAAHAINQLKPDVSVCWAAEMIENGIKHTSLDPATIPHATSVLGLAKKQCELVIALAEQEKETTPADNYLAGIIQNHQELISRAETLITAINTNSQIKINGKNTNFTYALLKFQMLDQNCQKRQL